MLERQESGKTAQDQIEDVVRGVLGSVAYKDIPVELLTMELANAFHAWLNRESS
jgi:hypothetical protein